MSMEEGIGMPASASGVDLWNAAAGLFARWRLAVDLFEWEWDGAGIEHDPPSTYELTGRGGDGAYYRVEWSAPGEIAVYRFGADGGPAVDWSWEITPRRAYQSVTNEPAPAWLADTLAGFAPWPREDELFAYRPDGGEVAALLMWRDNDERRRPYLRPGVQNTGPVPPRVGALLTLPGQPEWPEDLWDQWPARIWPLIDDGRITPLTEVAAGSATPPLWLTPVDGRDEGAVQWVGPAGPGLPAAGVYNSRIDGDRAELTADGCDATPLGDFCAGLLADRVAVDAALAGRAEGVPGGR